MDAQPVSLVVGRVLHLALGIARLQELLALMPPQTAKSFILEWREGGVITDEEAELLIEFNNLEAA
ncbi:MAG TPA: hypothetical protein VJ775_01475 [Sphingomicrobium sp.]|nr:hypothetical protein [Sphingomicrobium sp.]